MIDCDLDDAPLEYTTPNWTGEGTVNSEELESWSFALHIALDSFPAPLSFEMELSCRDDAGRRWSNAASVYLTEDEVAESMDEVGGGRYMNFDSEVTRSGY